MGCDKRFVYGLDEISRMAQYLKQKFNVCRIFAFYGPLGAGKTTLARELLLSCAVEGPITSPTFTYLNAYKNAQGRKFYHFDLYRLSNLNDFLGAGFGEYLDDPEAICLIEWPEIIESLLTSGVCKVKIDYAQEGKKRVLSCEVVE
ncbi:tRNA (adenosine(37)-N6)-threonylcarbamoyltransferase complex ATPase subunit type 1 TsaE [Candidatus Dependentiae bacterium]